MSEALRSYAELEAEVRQYSIAPTVGLLALERTLQGRADDPDLMLARLRRQSASPFNEEVALQLLWNFAQSLCPALGSHELIVADEISGIPPAVLAWLLTNSERSKAGQPPAKIGFMNGRYLYPTPTDMFPARTSRNARTLVVTDLVSSGSSAESIGRAVANSRGEESIDLAAVVTIRKTLSLGPGSEFYHSKSGSYEALLKHLYGKSIGKPLGRTKSPGSLHSSHVYGTNPATIQRAYKDIAHMALVFDQLLNAHVEVRAEPASA